MNNVTLLKGNSNKVIKMAKEITPTPVLKGKEAVIFLLDMDKPASEEKKQMLKRIRQNHNPDLF